MPWIKYIISMKYWKNIYTHNGRFIILAYRYPILLLLQYTEFKIMRMLEAQPPPSHRGDEEYASGYGGSSWDEWRHQYSSNTGKTA